MKECKEQFEILGFTEEEKRRYLENYQNFLDEESKKNFNVETYYNNIYNTLEIVAPALNELNGSIDLSKFTIYKSM